MISWLVFSVGAILSLVLSIIVNYSKIHICGTFLIFIVALTIIIAINGIVATIVAKCLPDKIFNKDNKFFSPNAKEIKFYNKIKIKDWKDKTIEWGKLNGFSKSKIQNPNDPEYINKFIFECNKGYLVHFISLFAAVLIFFVVPKIYILPMALPMFVTSFILNYIPIMILRYNVYRLKTVLKYIERHNNA